MENNKCYCKKCKPKRVTKSNKKCVDIDLDVYKHIIKSDQCTISTNEPPITNDNCNLPEEENNQIEYNITYEIILINNSCYTIYDLQLHDSLIQLLEENCPEVEFGLDIKSVLGKTICTNKNIDDGNIVSCKSKLLPCSVNKLLVTLSFGSDLDENKQYIINSLVNTLTVTGNIYKYTGESLSIKPKVVLSKTNIINFISPSNLKN